jgi:transposase
MVRRVDGVNGAGGRQESSAQRPIRAIISFNRVIAIRKGHRDRGQRSRSSPADLVWREGPLGGTLWLRLRELILTADKIAVDETTAPVLDPGRGRTKKGFFCAVARDDRSWGGTDPPAVAYTNAPGRGAVHAIKLLDGYRGIVRCDGYAAYNTTPRLTRRSRSLSARDHLRRRFFDIAEGGHAPMASEALARIADLYAIEKTIRGRSTDERRAVRRERSRPLVLALKAWFEQQLARVSAKAIA